MNLITRTLILKIREIVNFIVLEGESKDEKDFIGMDMCRKFLEMGFTRARRYANHNSGRKYKKGTRDILPQEKDHATSKYAHSATIFKRVRDIVARNDIYVKMRKEWRASE